MARVKVQITTPSNNVIKVSPGVSALSSVQLYLNELIDVNSAHGAEGYVLTQQADGTFAMEAVATTLSDLSDTNILNPQGGDSLVYDAGSQKWVPGGVKSVNGQDGDVVITIPSPPPTPGVSGLADTNITSLQDDQIIRYDSFSGEWLNEDLEALPAGGTTGQALVKATGTDYDVEWADIAIDTQYHDRFATNAETFRSGATDTVELYYTAKADGDGLAESASSDTPTAGKIIRRKIYYSEAAFADPDTGTWVEFTPAPADDASFATVKAALLEYLKARTGGTVPISLKQTWEEADESSLLLDTYTGAAAAYSLRKLRSLYTGDAVEVYNGSSYADIGFSNDELDTTALAAHCGSNDGFVSKWYDQSSNTNDAAQTNTARMPKIYDGTTGVVTENGKPAVDFDGSDDFFGGISKPSSTPAETMAMVLRLDVTTDQRMVGHPTPTTETGFPRFFLAAGNFAYNDYEASPTITTRALSPADTNLNLIFADVNDTTKTAHIYKNGIAGTNGSTLTKSLQLLSYSETDIKLGSNRNGGSPFLNGKMQEYIRWDIDRATNRTNIESNINTFYNIYS